MFVVERTFDNGTTRLYGPMIREVTAERFIKNKVPVSIATHCAIRELHPWRSFKELVKRVA